MKTHRITTVCKIPVLLLAATMLYGCVPGGSASTRKKMPEFNSLQGLEGPMPFEKGASAYKTDHFAFTTSNVEIETNGNAKQYVAVPLPNPANDSLAIGLINSFKPFALPLLSSWAKQQRNGVVIDLSNHNSEILRTDYVIEKTGDFSIPIVIMWDKTSAPRIATLKTLIDGIPEVKLNRTAGYDPNSKFGR